MAAEPHLYGILAEFNSPEALLDATGKARAQGYRALEAFTPFPIDGLAELLDFHDRRVPFLSLIGGCIGFALALGMQFFTNFSYPINVGGRPIYALSAFAVVTFELTLLFAALLPVVGMLCLNGLPRLHHPLFAASRFHLASKDRFFLCIMAIDPEFNSTTAIHFLNHLDAMSVEAVPT